MAAAKGVIMKDLILDGAGWTKRDDLYDDFFRAVGAPQWHGRNFNALKDSIVNGSINAIETPYTVVIRNYDRIGPGVKQIASDFVDLIQKIRDSGSPVDVRIECSK